MHLPIQHLPPPSSPPAIVRVLAPRDVVWNRPIFKAPPILVPALDHKRIAQDLQRIGLLRR